MKFYYKKIAKKETEVDRICPLCRVFGRNINLYDAKTNGGISITVATCVACKGLYHIENDAENEH